MSGRYKQHKARFLGENVKDFVPEKLGYMCLYLNYPVTIILKELFSIGLVDHLNHRLS